MSNQRKLVVDDRVFDVYIRDGEWDLPCAYVYEHGALVSVMSPFVTENAPDWMMANVIREVLAREAAFAARQDAAV